MEKTAKTTMWTKRLFSFVIAIIATMCMSTVAFAADVYEIRLKVTNGGDLELPEIDSRSSRYEITDISWSKTDDLVAGEKITAEVTVSPIDSNEIYISSKNDIDISGSRSELISYQRYGYDFKIKIRYTVKGELETPEDAYWDEDDPWIARCTKVSNADDYEFVLYDGNRKVHREVTSKNYFNFAKYLAQRGVYEEDEVYFKVRALADDNDESDYIESSEFYDWYELWYYCGEKNIEINGKNNHETDSGHIILNGWVQDLSGTWSYYFNNTRLTGWQFVDNRWYYLDGRGIMKTGWIILDNKWYYLNEDGAMATGWIYLNYKWYWAEQSGEIVLNDWRNINNNWYYFNSSGEAVKGWNWINNAMYYFYPTKTGEHPECSMAHDAYIDGFYVDTEGRRM